nr:hypothetical protein [uncultured Flavobacterium sp.]
MKKKSLSDSSLEEIIENKKYVKKSIITFAILWTVVLSIMIIISRYNLFLIFFPVAIATIIPIYIYMGQINSEIKKRNS